VGRIIVLDAGPLGMASNPRGKSAAVRCRTRINELDAAGVRIVVPEIAYYEVSRELFRVGTSAGIARLDVLVDSLEYAAITADAIRLAARYWAMVRQAGGPTADRHALDADCILAAQTAFLGGTDDIVTIATTNLGHLTRFPLIDARLWEEIEP
jgi:predicted nucleic acid-binding protein